MLGELDSGDERRHVPAPVGEHAVVSLLALGALPVADAPLGVVHVLRQEEHVGGVLELAVERVEEPAPEGVPGQVSARVGVDLVLHDHGGAHLELAEADRVAAQGRGLPAGAVRVDDVGVHDLHAPGLQVLLGELIAARVVHGHDYLGDYLAARAVALHLLHRVVQEHHQVGARGDLHVAAVRQDPLDVVVGRLVLGDDAGVGGRHELDAVGQGVVVRIVLEGLLPLLHRLIGLALLVGDRADLDDGGGPAVVDGAGLLVSLHRLLVLPRPAQQVAELVVAGRGGGVDLADALPVLDGLVVVVAPQGLGDHLLEDVLGAVPPVEDLPVDLVGLVHAAQGVVCGGEPPEDAGVVGGLLAELQHGLEVVLGPALPAGSCRPGGCGRCGSPGSRPRRPGDLHARGRTGSDPRRRTPGRAGAWAPRRRSSR